MHEPERPTLAIDLFSDESILDPYPGYRAVRDAAPAVWLPEHDVWGIGRFDDVRAALRADEILVSGRGVALNDMLNAQPGSTTLTSDGDEHRKRRSVMMRPMMPRALAEVRPRIEKLSGELVDRLLTLDTFDGIADFAQFLPVAVVSQLVGLPEEGRERMLEWAAAGFNALGPANERCLAGLPVFSELIRYAASVETSRLRPDGWAAGIMKAADAGEIDAQDARSVFIDYVAPSLDTTLLATGHLLHLLGRHPDQYEQVRANPKLIPSAVNEALRFASPVRAFTRLAVKAYRTGDIDIPEGDRVLILYGSANRDERHYSDPDRFDVTRDARDHLAYGSGVHRCAGSHLAQLELEALLRAVVERVRRIEVGEPRILMSNMLHGYDGFDASFN